MDRFDKNSMNLVHIIGRLLMTVLFFGILSACGSSATRNSGSYHNTGYYDSYYRSGINSHHYRHYRHPRPVRRPALRR